jgi:hypothetical protein
MMQMYAVVANVTYTRKLCLLEVLVFSPSTQSGNESATESDYVD